MKHLKTNFGSQGVPGMRLGDSANFFLVRIFLKFFAYKSILSPIVVGFELKFE